MCSEHREPSAIYFHYIRQQAEKNKIRETRREWISRATGKKFVKFWRELSLKRFVSPVPGTRKAALEHTSTTDSQPVCTLCACMTGKHLSNPLRWCRMFPLLKKRRLLTANTLKTQFIFIPLSPI